jgi:hypothetical protein
VSYGCDGDEAQSGNRQNRQNSEWMHRSSLG